MSFISSGSAIILSHINLLASLPLDLNDFMLYMDWGHIFNYFDGESLDLLKWNVSSNPLVTTLGQFVIKRVLCNIWKVEKVINNISVFGLLLYNKSCRKNSLIIILYIHSSSILNFWKVTVWPLYPNCITCWSVENR